MFEKEIKFPENYKYIAVFPTMRCNLDCSFCLNALNQSRDFNRLKFKEISGQEWINALNKINSPNIPITFSGGEPFLHRDFIQIINNLKPSLNIDILTNLQWGDFGINNFIQKIDPKKINRNAPYPSIRVSYHPEQMKNPAKLVTDVKRLQDAGFSIGIFSVQYPSPKQLQAITQMQFRCADEGILFRVKDFTGEYKNQLYGDYSKYPQSVNSLLKNCLCKTSELLIGPDGNTYRCHRDLFKEENSIGNITHPEFQVQDIFRTCNKYGECHPCDVKVKTNHKQQLGHTSVEIKNAE
ncbi:radical SAM/SPASM domain-containing protein [Nanoarchaeota archaeon]